VCVGVGVGVGVGVKREMPSLNARDPRKDWFVCVCVCVCVCGCGCVCVCVWVFEGREALAERLGSP
jgi:hypothetical protein